jgi:RNA polymerase sigma factor (sigma-70 family)
MREPTDDTTDSTVAQLVVAAQAGDDRSWDELVGRYDGMVHAVAIGFRLQEADVADAAQGTWLRAVEQLHTVRDPERFGGWLRTIAHRECVGVRAGGRRDHLDARVGEHVVEPEPGPEDQALRAELHRAVWAAVETLTGRGRTLVEAQYFPHRCSPHRSTGYTAIAQTAGMPMGSIGPTRARALRLLRQRLERTGFSAARPVTGRSR